MLRNSTYHYNLPADYHNIQQMAVAGDMMEDFVVIFRDMMGRLLQRLRIAFLGRLATASNKLIWNWSLDFDRRHTLATLALFAAFSYSLELIELLVAKQLGPGQAPK